MKTLLTNEKLKWYGTDLDGTLVETFPPEFDLENAKPISENCKFIRKVAKEGWKIIIYTARPSFEYIDIEKWLKKYRIPFRQIVTGKTLCKYYFDDKAINPNCKECMERINKSL